MSGILASAIGESPAEQEKRVEEAKKTATDLTGLVRHKKKPVKEESEVQADAKVETTTNGSKRKADDLEEAEGETADASKKAKLEDGAVTAEA